MLGTAARADVYARLKLCTAILAEFVSLRSRCSRCSRCGRCGGGSSSGSALDGSADKLDFAAESHDAKEDRVKEDEADGESDALAMACANL